MTKDEEKRGLYVQEEEDEETLQGIVRRTHQARKDSEILYRASLSMGTRQALCHRTVLLV